MSEFDLDALTRALREEHSGEDKSRSGETLDRVVLDLKSKKVSFLSMRRAPLLLLAAAFVCGTALAGATGRLNSMLAAVDRWVSGREPEQTAAPAVAKGSPAIVPEAAIEDASLSVLEEPEVAKPQLLEPAAPATGPRPEPRVAPSGSTVAAPTAPTLDEASLDESLYREAHRLHFVDQNWSGALTAWEQYLSQAKRGKFGLEARYNRAICLVRLGRSDQARKALEPFARGEYGAYRQAEAQALIEKLR